MGTHFNLTDTTSSQVARYFLKNDIYAVEKETLRLHNGYRVTTLNAGSYKNNGKELVAQIEKLFPTALVFISCKDHVSFDVIITFENYT